MIYLDNAATTPISDIALETYVHVAKHYFGNPNSHHDIGSEAKQLLDASRRTIATILGAEQDEIVFTSGGSESNQLAIKALLSASDESKDHIIATDTEHSSIRNFINKIERQGYKVSRLRGDEHGMTSFSELEKLITPDTAVVSIQHANSETGVIHDVEKMGKVCRQRGVLFHSDCVQTFCKVGVNAKWFDALSVSSHKIYGPKGVGAVYLNKKVDAKPDVPGTSQEFGFKAGTQDVPGIAAFAAAAKQLNTDKERQFLEAEELRSLMIKGLQQNEIDFTLEGSPKNYLPNILGMRFHGMEGQFLMLECSQAGVAISTGSACQVGEDKPNRTLKAMGRTDEEAREFVRLSLGKNNTKEEIDLTIQKISAILKRHLQKVKF